MVLHAALYLVSTAAIHLFHTPAISWVTPWRCILVRTAKRLQRIAGGKRSATSGTQGSAVERSRRDRSYRSLFEILGIIFNSRLGEHIDQLFMERSLPMMLFLICYIPRYRVANVGTY